MPALWLACTAGALAQSNGVLREVYYNIAGGAVADLTNAPSFPNNPDETFIESAFEAPSNFADNYGQRMRALLLPPATGSYVFWIATDDNGALFLSQDANPAHKVLIAYESSWVNPRQWNAHPSQKSAPISLTKGGRYYLEALQKEGTGGDNLAVTWQKPGDSPPADGDPPIAGAYLAPYGLGPPVITLQPTSVSVVENGNATFTVQIGQKLGAVYQWRRNGLPVAGATNTLYAISPAALSDSGGQFSCFITNGYGSTNSAAAKLTVTPDVTRPYLTSVSSPGNPQVLTVIFSEPVEPASATNAANYTLNNGATVLSAVFGPDPRMVILSTTPMLAQTSYTLTVSNVRDRAATPNVIAPNSSWTFTLTPNALDISYVRPAPEPIGPASRHGPVIISELMYHPTNRLDGKNLEYVELYNANPYYEDLSGFRLAGQVEFTFPSNTVLAARSYAVLAAAPADLQAVYGIENIMGSYTNRLSQRSGTVQLLNREGGIVFEVTYSGDPPWPAAADGAGHSLVLARPSLGEGNPAAWAASELLGGSPGWGETPWANPWRTVVLNEFLAYSEPPDYNYIELFNYSSAPVDLSGCVLTDDPLLNKFVIPPGTSIPALGFVCFSETNLNFMLNAAGQTLYLKDADTGRVIEAVRFAAQAKGVAMGRSPDGAPGFYPLATKTPGASNGPQRIPEVGINEIMYDPISGDDNDQYVELYNRTSAPVDLARWSFESGIKYTFPAGASIPANGYLVVAKNAVRLLTNFPNLTAANTLGNFSGTLAHGGEQLALAMPGDLVTTNLAGVFFTNLIHIVVDEVTYGAGGRWGQWAHGGGSSLELIDPRSDHRLAPNWADSDETGKSAWTTIAASGVLDNGNGPADSLQIILLGAGECLVDKVEVFAAGGANLVANADFESGLDGWVVQGNHDHSSWEIGQGYNSAHCLHVRAAGHGDTGANCLRTALTSPLNQGQTATLRAKVRWLAGWPELLLRLKGNWLEATGNTLTARNLGTPGAPNSRAAPNAGPAITDVKTSPILPVAGQSVTVMARVYDPDGLAELFLKYRLDPSTNLNLALMANNGAGLFSATIPGQPAGALVAFHIQAMDNSSPGAVTLFPNDAPARECLVRFGDPPQPASFGTYRLWMTGATLDRWSNREHLSSQPLDCTFVYGNSRVVYNVGACYSGSPWHGPGYNSPMGNSCNYDVTFPDDDPLLGETDAIFRWPGNGGGDTSCQREQTAYWIAEQMGLPYTYRRHINLFVNGLRRGQMFEDTQRSGGDMDDEFWPNGGNGDLYKVSCWFEFDNALANFSAIGASFQNVTTTGGQKELAFYRWTFGKRAIHGSASNYTNLFALVDAANFRGLGDTYRRQLESTLDLDNWLKTYAVEHIVGNNDSFAYGSGQNMYAYKPVGDTWKMTIWDIDFAFLGLPSNSDPFQGIGRSNGIDLGEPAYARRYWQALQDLANGPLSGTKLFPLLDAKYRAITANGLSIENPSAIKDYINQRRTNLLGLIASNVPAAFAITLNHGAGFSTNGNRVALTGTAPIDVRAIAINGVPYYPVTWTTVSNWTAQVVLAPGANLLTVQGCDALGNQVAGASATLTINYTGPVELPQDKLVFNEIMYHPAAPQAAFVEFYNTSLANAFDLSGWQLSGADFTFPAGCIIAPNGFLVVAGNRAGFAAAYGATNPVVGEFAGALDNGAQSLRLVKPGATAADDLVVAQVRYDVQAPWPAAANGTGSSLQLIDSRRDDWRVGNWAAVPSSFQTPVQWVFVRAYIAASSSTIYLYLGGPGDLYLDDLQLVGSAGTNVLANGDFESPLSGTWNLSPNFASSALSTVIKHAGDSSLHLVATAAGTGSGNAVYQYINPPLDLSQIYALSFWYLQSTNAGAPSLTVRLASSDNPVIVNPVQPPPVVTNLARATPGAANSLRDSLAPFPPLWLNELQADNLTGLTNHAGQRTAWLELYNPTTNTVSLDGLYLANNYTNLTQWAFPAGAALGPRQFEVIFADGQTGLTTSNELHTSFTLASGAGSLALSQLAAKPQPQVLDYVDYTNLTPDHSYGSWPDGQSFLRQEFYYATPGGTNNIAAAPLSVLINEWMAANQTTLPDPADGHFDDWFELYNAGDTTADLAGNYLGQSLANKTKFLIPHGYTLPPHGYLLVWADNEPSQNSPTRPDLHVNFKLAKAGDAIGLFAPDGTVLDFVSFGPQTADLSQGRFPDGAAFILTLTRPTPQGANFLLLPNSPPLIGALTNRLVFDGQWLVFTATATDTDTPPQHLTFSLDPGAPTNAVINPDTGLFAWRPAPDQAPATNSITVRVTDDGAPPLSAATTFTVRVEALPRVSAVVPNPAGNGCALTFSTVPGKTYRVEFKDSLADSNWQPVAPDSVALEESLTILDQTAPGPQRYYRVVLVE
jgi:hypothetical protein